MRNSKTSQMVAAALLAAATAVLAQIILPLGPVPFSLAAFGVFFMGFTLSAKYAAASVCVYLFLGFIGVPVFASFGAGPAVLAGPTGGYVLGYFAMAVLPAFARRHKLPAPLVFLAALAGLCACYAVGTVWYSFLTGQPVAAALGICVFPFILPDIVKAALAMWLAAAVRKRSSYH